MEPQTKRVENPIAQGTGDHIIAVYPDQVEFVDGLQDRSTFSVGLEEVAVVSIKGLVNCALTIEVNDGRCLNVERTALPDARRVKAAIERQKRTPGL